MEEIKYHYDSCGVHAFTNFSDKVYIDCGNVLRAAYLLRVEWHFINKNIETKVTERSYVKMFFNAAGLGEYEVDSTHSLSSSPETVGINKSAKAFKDKSKELKWDYLRMSELLGVIFDGVAGVSIDNRYSSSFNVFRWGWNGVKAEKVYLEFSKATLTKDGWTTDAVIPNNTYATRKECESANQISVIEFE